MARAAEPAFLIQRCRELWAWVQVHFGAVIEAITSFLANGNLVISGHLAFVGLMSLFPFLMLLTSIAGAIGAEQETNDAIMLGLKELPDEVADVVQPVVGSILAQPSGGVLTMSVAAALWAASSGFEALRHALTISFRITDQRVIWWRRLHSLLIALSFAILGALVALLFVLAPFVAQAIAWTVDEPELVPRGSEAISTGLILLLLVLVNAVLYRYLPNIRTPWPIVLRAGLVSVVLWALAVQGFQLYLTHIATANAVYGSISGVITLLLFLYLTACIFLFGGEYSAAVERRRRPE